MVRARRPGLRSNRPAYNALRNHFLASIGIQKMAAWKGFANDINEKPWGKAFKWAKNGSTRSSIPNTLVRHDGTYTSDCRETAELVLDTFVPSDPVQGDWVYNGPLEKSTDQTSDLDPAILNAAIWRIKPSSAPGTDGISSRMIRKAWQALSAPITCLFSKCISEGKFPEKWYTAKLVIIPKPGDGDKDRVKSYRLIILLPVLGKALETIIIQAIDRQTILNTFEEQHGFTTGKSTTTAIK